MHLCLKAEDVDVMNNSNLKENFKMNKLGLLIRASTIGGTLVMVDCGTNKDKCGC